MTAELQRASRSCTASNTGSLQAQRVRKAVVLAKQSGDPQPGLQGGGYSTCAFQEDEALATEEPNPLLKDSCQLLVFLLLAVLARVSLLCIPPPSPYTYRDLLSATVRLYREPSLLQPLCHGSKQAVLAGQSRDLQHSPLVSERAGPTRAPYAATGLKMPVTCRGKEGRDFTISPFTTDSICKLAYNTQCTNGWRGRQMSVTSCLKGTSPRGENG
ncbi:uncharacterized protein LOC123378883 [Mauremys mutica]|uniref:uncharacterized protein LOC123378883 n=1 Tax=Mauremys mutica TaxID=74926 RepID=UPI001D13F172|nr:uncharacterized protein LOC123378883 [Mauremys mutica]